MTRLIDTLAPAVGALRPELEAMRCAAAAWLGREAAKEPMSEAA